MLQHAFKEWAVICKALAVGHQALILRKGGIAESGGTFVVEHTRFWLYPTWTHQQQHGIQPEAGPLLEEALAERPAAGRLRLTHFAEVAGAYHVRDLTAALLLAHLHLYADGTVEKRFAYGSPGLYVLPVRVYRATGALELPELPEYAGCRSWVTLTEALPTAGATPVLGAEAMRELTQSLDLLLNPSALA